MGVISEYPLETAFQRSDLDKAATVDIKNKQAFFVNYCSIDYSCPMPSLGGGTDLCGPRSILALLPNLENLREYAEAKHHGPFTYDEILANATNLVMEESSKTILPGIGLATGAGTYIVHVNNPTGVSHTVCLDISRGMCTLFDDAIGFSARVPSKSLPKWFLGNAVSVMKVGIKPGGVSSIRLGGARTGATGPSNVGGAPNAAAVCIVLTSCHLATMRTMTC
jgi:hypothetical protein